jgi:hypothetical protein
MTEVLPNVQSYVEETIATLPSRLNLPSAEVIPSAVLYRDVDDPDNCVLYPFMPASDFLEHFPNLERESQVACFSKSDAADVAGAVHCARHLDWSDATVSLVVHCGITPPHGRMFNDVEDRYDQYPGEDPFGNNLLDDMKELSKMRVHYMFVRISERVDTMLELMHQVYDLPGTFTVVDCPVYDSESYTSEPDSVAE